jgi:energy-coupling factor transport system ATP-binding protein
MEVVPTAEDVVVRTRGLTYYYPESARPALRGIDLEVGRGEFVLLVGASGSGKSTLLRALNGLVPRYHGGHFRGTVEVAGLRAGAHPIAELATKVGLVFQDPERQAVMSRVDNEVAFGLECLGTPTDEISGRVADALDAVGLSDMAEDMVSELSSGQAQRLALASVLAMEPEVLALDEPTSQLDPEAAEEFLGHLDRERRSRGATVVMAEHRLERSFPFADRVVALDGGRIAFDGSPEEFLQGGWEGAKELSLTAIADPLTDRQPADDEVEDAPRTVIECKGVRFSYEAGKEVLRGADLELNPGEVLALVGPNGSGKTTLARHLNGLLRPSEGRIRVAGVDSSARTVAELAKEVALLTQNPGDYLFERTVRAELRLTAEYRGLEGAEASREIQVVVQELGLEGFLDRFSWDLSAGQRQRVALGALLVGAPRVIILDEPTRGMDAAHKAGLAALARRQAAEGKAVMIITHDMEFATRAADRFAVMEDGRIVVTGPPEDVFAERPTYRPALWGATEPLELPSEPRSLASRRVSPARAAVRGGGAW